jgi:hypothetical protein
MLATIRFSLLSSRLLSRNVKVKIYKTIILQVILYGCETWSLTLREEHRLRVFENRVLGRIFGPKREDVTGEWRKLHSEELHNLYVKSRRMRWARHVARMGEERKCTRFWWENQKESDHLEDQGVYGIRMALREIGWGGGWIGCDWIRIGTGGQLL